MAKLIFFPMKPYYYRTLMRKLQAGKSAQANPPNQQQPGKKPAETRPFI